MEHQNCVAIPGRGPKMEDGQVVADRSRLSGQCSNEEQRLLLDLAAGAVRDAVTAGAPTVAAAPGLSARLLEPCACFVTLTKAGKLRGCIGHLTPQLPLWQAVIENARSAALRDTRFAPVAAEELTELRLEISLLTEPRKLDFATPEELLERLHPHQDGVVLGLGSRSATFLPQVWATIPDKENFLNRLALKAGGAADEWRGPGTQVSVYQVESFGNAEGAAKPPE